MGSGTARMGFIAVLGLCLITSVACYMKIYSFLHCHQRQVHGSVQQAQQPSSQGAQFYMARYKKTVSRIAWIQLTLLFFFISYMVVGMLFTHKKMPPGNARVVLFRVSVSLLYLNSSLNPILYVWKIREVKNIVKAEIRALNCC